MAWFLPGVLSNLFGGPATRLYPFQKREPFPRARGHIEFDESKCNLCTLCARRCPAAAISVDREGRTYTFWPFRCIICEACVEACPRKAISLKDQWRAPAYAKATQVYNVIIPEKPAAGAAKAE